MGRIVWIASYPRSGNTWVRYFLLCLLQGLRREPVPDINRLYRFSTWDALNVWWAERIGKPLEQASKAEVAAGRATVQATIASAGPQLSFVKTHNAWASVGGHATINAAVTAAAIYLVRNPLDIAVSSAAYLNIPQDDAIARLNQAGYETYNMKGGVYELYGSWQENLLSWVDRKRPPVLALRYEDLLEAPEAAFARLAAFVGMKADAATLRQAIAAASFARLEGQEARDGFIERPDSARQFFRSGASGQWRDALTPAQVAAVVEPNRALMRRFGYLPESGA